MRYAWLALLLALCVRPHVASASLVPAGPLPIGNLDLAKPPVILTIHGPNADTVSGCVGWDGFTDIIGPDACPDTDATGGDEMTGSSQTLTLSVQEAGITSAENFAVFFKPSEPRYSTLVLDNLVLRVFSQDGTVLFTSGPFVNAMVVTERYPHQEIGFLFRVPVEDLESIPTGVFTNPTNRIGLAATLSGASGGPEKFGIIAWDAPPEPVPEPAPVLLIATSLLALFLGRHRQPPNRSTG
jgi:hypothetical protein